jgi:predicted Zn-dependent protease with MMP-like domain
MIQVCTDEILFLKQFLSSDVFKANPTDFYEKLNSYAIELGDLQSDKVGVQLSLKHHKNDLNGMLECEDISCDMFYLNQHQKLNTRIEVLLAKHQDLKLNIFRFTTPHLKTIE